MKRAGLIWTLAVATSLGAHAAGAVALYVVTRPGDIAEQPVPETRLELAAYQVQRSIARETSPDADQAMAADTAGTALGQGPVAMSRAASVETSSIRTTTLSAHGDRIPAEEPQGAQAETATTDDLAAQPAAPVALATLSITSVARVTTGVSASAVPAPVDTASETALSIPATALRPAQTVVSRPAEPKIAALSAPSLIPENAVLQNTAPDPVEIAQQPVNTELAQSMAPKAYRAKAALAFQGVGDGPVDPVSLAAFQSFMQPGDIAATAADVRDGITGILSSVPCSRLQVEFDPTDNSLVVTGHVPEPELRASVVSAMQQQMGNDIPVRDNLLILPRPQCAALSGIASVGLPQSTDQITNPLLVGESAHAREFRYIAGNPLVMALQGADYDAYVYVDYFDANGNVLHLMPNQFTPLAVTPAQSALQIGSETVLAAGEPGLYIEIGPPFGQEIAAAFASSVPLYDGVRPLVEPADPYLDWLRDRVAEARAAHPDFKGEWVYFFVTTAAE